MLRGMSSRGSVDSERILGRNSGVGEGNLHFRGCDRWICFFGFVRYVLHKSSL